MKKILLYVAFVVFGFSQVNAQRLSSTPYTPPGTNLSGIQKPGGSPVLNPQPSSTNTICGDPSATGGVSVIVQNGTSPYTYVWTNSNGVVVSQTYGSSSNMNSSPDTLSNGIYEVVVTDGGDSIRDAYISVTTTSGIQPSSTQTNEHCFGDCIATASPNATEENGLPYTPFTYSWAPSGGSGPTASNLCVTGSDSVRNPLHPIPAIGLQETYTCTITNTKGCVQPVPITITEPLPLVLTPNAVPAKCNGVCDGTAAPVTSGGTPPYTYTWTPTPSGGANTANQTALCAITYTLEVADANNCTVSTNITITEPPPIVATATTTASTCGLNNGTATASASGGTPAYTYSWSPGGETTAHITGLAAGTYTCTVTDANGCGASTSTAIAVVIAIPRPVITPDSTAVTCFGFCNGTASTIVTLGTSPYTYLWAASGTNNGNGATTTGISGLCPGTYTITVTDANGCHNSKDITISQPPLLTAGMISTGVLCNSGPTGTATVLAGGGTTAYTYSWAPAPAAGQTTATATGLPVGSYTATVTDANGCLQTASVSITQPPVLRDSITSITIPLCNGYPTGGASVGVKGGTTPYTYLWTNSSGVTVSTTNSTLDTLIAGTYTAMITDNNGCDSVLLVTITQPPLLLSQPGVRDASCGGNNGIDYVGASGGTPPYTYVWDAGTTSSSTASSLSGLAPGTTYTLSVTDMNGCSNSALAITVTAPPLVIALKDSSNVTCFGLSNGTATVTPSGGIAPYTYSWSWSSSGTTSIGTNASISSLSPGTYTATVTDNTLCDTTTATFIITQPLAALAINITGSTNVLCNGYSTGTATTGSGASGGTTPYTYSWAGSGTCISASTAASASDLCAGTWTVTVQDINGCSATAPVVITQPSAIVITPTAPALITCYGADNGGLGVSVGGGVSPYTYSWINSSSAVISTTNSTPDTLIAGSYTLNVTDSNGCPQSLVMSITQPSMLTMGRGSLIPTPETCFGGNSGSITATPTGGTTPYTYLWEPGGQTTDAISNLPAGSYTVTVNDICGGGPITEATVITQPAALINGTASTTANELCFGNMIGQATATTPSGGTTPYTYSWSTNPAQSTQTASGLAAGSYTVTVTDNCGGNYAVSVLITQPTQLTQSCNEQDALCANVTGSATVDLNGGGTPPYTYTWGPSPASGQNSATVTGLPANTYTEVTTDANGCTSSCSSPMVISVDPPDSMFAQAGVTQTIYGTGVSVTLGGSPTGPSGCNYAWSSTPTNGGLNDPFSPNPIAIPTVTTIYNVSVSKGGCSANDTVTIFVRPGIVIPNVFTPGVGALNSFWHFDFGFPNMVVDVYDRWGLKLYSSTGATAAWAGTTSGGTLVPAGTYYYVVNMNDSRYPAPFKGFLTVIR